MISSSCQWLNDNNVEFESDQMSVCGQESPKVMHNHIYHIWCRELLALAFYHQWTISWRTETPYIYLVFVVVTQFIHWGALSQHKCWSQHFVKIKWVSVKNNHVEGHVGFILVCLRSDTSAPLLYFLFAVCQSFIRLINTL